MKINNENVTPRTKARDDLAETLQALYGSLQEFDGFLAAVFAAIEAAKLQRPQDLRDLDLSRQTCDQDWFLRQDMLAYMCYPDRFADNFKGIEKKIPYLKKLGISYLHMLSSLKPREGHSDGGFAIADYYAANPSFGTMEDLKDLARHLRENKISPCIDFVFNHTAMEHEWAQKAVAGDPTYQAYYYFFDDEKIPQAYEKNLTQVFPESSPGNFTYCEAAERWVWTTFYHYQWDLNYRNPMVFLEMLKAMLFLANQGIEIFRLDATAYLWKEKGTNCLNLPETHQLLQAFRAAVSLAAPAVCLKAEAIVGARYISKYLGDPAGQNPECHLSYHNALMASYWDSLATGDISRMSQMLKALPPKPVGTSWITYLRCHDDIGWGALVDDQGAPWAVTAAQLKMVTAFYGGGTEGSFARGQSFQASGQNVAHGTNGTLASLAGLEKALDEGKRADIEMAVARILLGYMITFSFGGIPLIYMGEEVGLLNDYEYNKQDSMRDGRWLHRPIMSHEDDVAGTDLAQARSEIFLTLQHLAQLRSREPLFHADVSTDIVDCGNQHVFSFLRRAGTDMILVMGNFSQTPQHISLDDIYPQGFGSVAEDLLTGRRINLRQGLTVSPYQGLWLKSAGGEYEHRN